MSGAGGGSGAEAGRGGNATGGTTQGSNGGEGGSSQGLGGSGYIMCQDNQAGAAGEAGEPQLFWDWAGVVGTGQSLAVGEQGNPVKSTTQSYSNLKLSTGDASWPIDPDATSFELVPLTEPIGRRATAYPSAYPTNISGETPHTAMANQISALVQRTAGVEHIGVHGEFGENGQCLSFLKKGAPASGVNGRAYQATLLETQAITRLAGAAGKTYGIGAIIVTHGECDAGNRSYAEELYQLWGDYNEDLSAITGQHEKIQMLISQQNGVGAGSALAQWRVAADHPEHVVCTGPKYQYPYAQDRIHLVTDGYRLLGEKYGQVYFERVVMGRDWQPLQPTTVSRQGRVISVEFHVPVPPLVWDAEMGAPLQNVPEWRAGNGFEVRAGTARLAIEKVEIECNTVHITCEEDLPASNVFVGYALTANTEPLDKPTTGPSHWGRLRDSDPFVGEATGVRQPNYALAFELEVP